MYSFTVCYVQYSPKRLALNLIGLIPAAFPVSRKVPIFVLQSTDYHFPKYRVHFAK